MVEKLKEVKVWFDPDERSVFVEFIREDGGIVRREWRNLSSREYMEVAHLHIWLMRGMVDDVDYNISEDKIMHIYNEIHKVFGFVASVDSIVL